MEICHQLQRLRVFLRIGTMYYGPSAWRQVSPPLIGQSRVRFIIIIILWLTIYIFRVLSKSRKYERFNRARYEVWNYWWWWCSNRCPVAGNPCPNTRRATRKGKRIKPNMDTKIYQVLFLAAGASEPAKQGWLFVLWIHSVGDAITIQGCSGQLPSQEKHSLVYARTFLITCTRVPQTGTNPSLNNIKNSLHSTTLPGKLVQGHRNVLQALLDKNGV